MAGNKDDKGPALIQDLISAISHDLRVPLAVVKESINLVLDGVPGNINDKQKRLLTVARDNIDKMVARMDELLNKAEGGGP